MQSPVGEDGQLHGVLLGGGAGAGHRLPLQLDAHVAAWRDVRRALRLHLYSIKLSYLLQAETHLMHSCNSIHARSADQVLQKYNIVITKHGRREHQETERLMFTGFSCTFHTYGQRAVCQGVDCQGNSEPQISPQWWRCRQSAALGPPPHARLSGRTAGTPAYPGGRRAQRMPMPAQPAWAMTLQHSR